MGKNIISEDMIEGLLNMLKSENKNDRKLALQILNNRDLKDKETENNVATIARQYVIYVAPIMAEVYDENRLINAIDSFNQITLTIMQKNMSENGKKR